MVSRTLERPPHAPPKKAKPAPVDRPPASEATTPLMKQYLELKEAHPNEVLFFRMGDFYEMFFEDAEVVSRVLGIAVTSRANGSDAYAMAGFPHHALDRYLPRMIAEGFRVAICEQVEDPALVRGKRIVERQVIEVVTPGTLTDERLLEERSTNFLLSLHLPRGKARARPCGLAWFEVSSGRFLVAEVARERLEAELERIGPAEILVASGVLDAARGIVRGADPGLGEEDDPASSEEAVLLAMLERHAPVTTVPDWVFHGRNALSAVKARFGLATLAGLGLSDQASYVAAAHAALHYVGEVKPGFLEHLERYGRGIELYQPDAHLCLDPATARCLEITRPLRDGAGSGGGRGPRGATLLGAIDRTQTAMGARLLKEWLLSPLRQVAAIEARQDAIAALLAAPEQHEALREGLKHVYDLERLAARAASGRATPRDLALHLAMRGLALEPRLQVGRFAVMEIIVPPRPACDWCQSSLGGAHKPFTQRHITPLSTPPLMSESIMSVPTTP